MFKLAGTMFRRAREYLSCEFGLMCIGKHAVDEEGYGRLKTECVRLSRTFMLS